MSQQSRDYILQLSGDVTICVQSGCILACRMKCTKFSLFVHACMYVALHVNVFSSLLACVLDPRYIFCCGTTKVNRFCLFKRVAQLLPVNLLGFFSPIVCHLFNVLWMSCLCFRIRVLQKVLFLLPCIESSFIYFNRIMSDFFLIYALNYFCSCIWNKRPNFFLPIYT